MTTQEVAGDHPPIYYSDCLHLASALISTQFFRQGGKGGLNPLFLHEFENGLGDDPAEWVSVMQALADIASILARMTAKAMGANEREFLEGLVRIMADRSRVAEGRTP